MKDNDKNNDHDEANYNDKIKYEVKSIPSKLDLCGDWVTQYGDGVLK